MHSANAIEFGELVEFRGIMCRRMRFYWQQYNKIELTVFEGMKCKQANSISEQLIIIIRHHETTDDDFVGSPPNFTLALALALESVLFVDW